MLYNTDGRRRQKQKKNNKKGGTKKQKQKDIVPVDIIVEPEVFCLGEACLGEVFVLGLDL